MSMVKCVMALAIVALLSGMAMGADPVPEKAKGFAGMITGKVVSKGEDQIVVNVTEIAKTWKHSKAQDAQSLVGKQVVVKIVPATYAKKEGYLAKVRAFFALLKVDDTETFDVKSGDGDALTFMEMTAAQAKRVQPAEAPK